jgi:hypothetical protein
MRTFGRKASGRIALLINFLTFFVVLVLFRLSGPLLLLLLLPLL